MDSLKAFSFKGIGIDCLNPKIKLITINLSFKFLDPEITQLQMDTSDLEIRQNLKLSLLEEELRRPL